MDRDVSEVLQQMERMDSSHLDLPLLSLLKEIGPPVVLVLIHNTTSAKQRRHLARLLCLYLEKHPEHLKMVTGQLLQLSRDSANEVVVASVDALNRLPVTPLIRGRFEQLQHHPDADVRRIASFGLAKK